MPRLHALVAILAAVSGPALAQTALRPGQTVQGELTAADSTLGDGSHYDCFTIQTRSGQTLQIDQISDAFDSYLQAGSGTCSGTLTNAVSDDDSGGGLNARLGVQGDGGVLTVRANSLSEGMTGRYTLRVSENGQPSTEPPAAKAAMAQQPSSNPGSDARQYPGPAPWVQPMALLSSVDNNRIFASFPQQSEPNNPTIWMWIYANPPQGVDPRAPDGGDGKFNIVAQHFRVDCRRRTTQGLYMQTFWWEFGGDMPRSVVSVPENGPAQPAAQGTPADQLVTRACDPDLRALYGTNVFPSARIGMMEIHRRGS